MKISTEHRDALNEALDETAGYEGDVYVFDVKHIEILRSAVIAMLEDDEQTTTVAPAVDAQPAGAVGDDGLMPRGDLERDPLWQWRCIANEAEIVKNHKGKFLMLSEEMCVRLGSALEDAAGHPASDPKPAVDAQPVWISVDEQMPNEGQSVAFVVSSASPTFAYLNGRVLGGYFGHVARHPTFSVPGLGLHASHWMPLPEAPAALSQHTGEKS